MNDLAQFALALRARVERDLDEHAPTPDVVDAIDRALALDEQAVPPSLRESAATHVDDEVVDAPDPELAPFAAALAGRVEGLADARRLEPVPERRRALVWPWLGAAGLIAAAIAAAVLWPSFATQQATEGERGDLEAAERSVESEPASGRATQRRPQRATSSAPAPAPAPAPPPAASASKPRPDRDPLDELEARAHAKWKAGDLAGAEDALRAVIRRSGRTRRAELAYADLFAVAHQRGGEPAQTKVWRAYLARFPQGRFADDVRAGLCRRGPATQRSACWTNYLEHHPHGAHAGQARKAVATQPK